MESEGQVYMNKISLKQDKPAKMYTRSVFKSVLKIRRDIKKSVQSTEISSKYWDLIKYLY